MKRVVEGMADVRSIEMPAGLKAGLAIPKARPFENV